MSCKKVLIIDDDEDIRQSISMALELEGYEILLAINGQEAVDMLETPSLVDELGLIILDMMMPKLTGEQVLERIIKTVPEFNVPIVMASAKGGHFDLPKHPQVVRWLSKPFNVDELFSTVKMHFKSK